MALVYEHHGEPVAARRLGVGVHVDADDAAEQRALGFFPAACHYLDGSFVPQPDQSQCPRRSPQSGAAFNFWHPDLYTMHLWIWYPNPAGLYSGTNPMITLFNGG